MARHREMLVQYRSAPIQHMQKALTLMNVRLTNVLSDITGVTGMKIIRAIVQGERNRKTLASYRDPKCAKSEEEIEKSLEGNYKLEHLFVLKQSLELYDFYDQFEEPDQPGTPAPKKLQRKRRKNQPHFDLSASLYRMTDGIDLTKIDGLDALTV